MSAPAGGLASDPKAFLGRGWAFPVRPVAGDIELVEHEQDIRQAVQVILGTGTGERAMRPDFGCGLRQLVFEPLTTTTMALVRHRVEEALVTWEPRIDQVEVGVTADRDQAGLLLIDIRYRVRATNTFYNLVYPFYLLEGRV
jgi:phage baseplate assembly protein W